MIDGRRVIAVVPARAGSKAIKNKNLRSLGGRPLLSWPIVVAQHVNFIDRIIVSTDGQEIAAVARQFEAEVYDRPAEHATDSAPIIDALHDLTDRLVAEGESPGVFVLLEATAPFRTPDDVAGCLQRMVDENLDSIATFASAHLNPHRAWSIENGSPRPFVDGAIPWTPRQQLPEAWQLTGTVYAFDPLKLPRNSPSILFGRFGAQIVDEMANLDIDTETDLKIANALFESSKLATLI